MMNAKDERVTRARRTLGSWSGLSFLVAMGTV